MMTLTPSDLQEDDAAYKKARRQYLKSIRNRPEQIEADWTPFRAAEKKYKAKFPPPDLNNVLDLALLDESRTEECRQGGWHGSLNVVEYRVINLSHASKRAYVFPSIPGLVVLPSFVSPANQRELVRISLRDHARYPNETNLDTHYLLLGGGLWNAYLREREVGKEESIPARAISTANGSACMVTEPGPRKLISNEAASKENITTLAATPMLPYAPSPNAKPASPSFLIPKLRWANIGWYYHWGTKQYDFTRGKIAVNPVYRTLCKRAVEVVAWDEVYANHDVDKEQWGDEPDWTTWHKSYEPDAGIVNFYQLKDTLMGHVDRSEVCATSPLVSISLGCAAVFLIGGKTRDIEPIALLLRSGDVAIMSGPQCRRAYHGVPRILEDTLPSFFAAADGDSEWAPYEEYLRTTRININVRQVFSKGFDPGLS